MRERRWWDRLSGSELTARLLQRGVGSVSTASLVRDRDGDMAAQIIDKYLREE